MSVNLRPFTNLASLTNTTYLSNDAEQNQFIKKIFFKTKSNVICMTSVAFNTIFTAENYFNIQTVSILYVCFYIYPRNYP